MGDPIPQSNYPSFGWVDLPAALLSLVNAITAMTGARLLRGQNAIVMLALGIGVASTNFLLKKHLVERLNSLRPRQSLFGILASWLPVVAFSTFLSTLATFAWIAPQLADRDAVQAFRIHWTRETEKVADLYSRLRTGLQARTDALQGDVEAEQRRSLAARSAGTPYDLNPLREMRRQLAATRDLQKRIDAFKPPSVEPPLDRSAAFSELDRIFRDAETHYTMVAAIVPDLVRPERYQPFDPPATDLQAVLFTETVHGSWQARVAWLAALWVEILPFCALYRGGRRVPLAIRIREWRRRTGDTVGAILGRNETDAVPIIVEPLQVRGTVRVVLPSEFTLADCMPFIDEAVEALRPAYGACDLRQVSSRAGRDIDEHLPLLPQLHGEPLVLTVEVRE